MPSILTSGTATTSSTSVTISAGAGDRLLAVFAHIEDAAATLPDGGATIDGVTMSATPTAAWGDNRSRWYYLLEGDLPAAGARTLTVTPSSTPGNIQIHYLLFDGAPLSSRISVQHANETYTNVDASITTAQANALVVSGIGIGNLQSITTGYGAMLATATSASSGSRVTSLLDAGAAGVESITWTMGGPANRHAASTVAFNAAGIPPAVAIDAIHGAGPAESVHDSAGFDGDTNTVTVTGTASDDISVSLVEVRVDGGSWVSATGTTSWSYALDLDTLSFADSHAIEARSQDGGGLYSTIASSTFYYSPSGRWVYGSPHLRPVDVQIYA